MFTQGKNMSKTRERNANPIYILKMFRVSVDHNRLSFGALSLSAKSISNKSTDTYLGQRFQNVLLNKHTPCFSTATL